MKKQILLMIVLSSLTFISKAQWQTSGPSGKIVRTIASSSTKVFGGADYTNELYVSGNNGNNWTTSTALAQCCPTTIAVSGNNIFVGSGSKLFLSSNDGSTWTEKQEIFCGYTSIVTIGSKIFAAGSNLSCGVYLSTDNGDTWNQVNNGLPNDNNLDVYTLAANGTDLLLGTENGLYRSPDNGANWTLLSSTKFTGIAASGSNIYAATYGLGVYYSANNGTTWTTINNGLTDLSVYSILMKGSTILAGTGDGVHTYSINTNTWEPVNTGLPAFSFIWSLAANATHVFAGVVTNGTMGMGIWQRPLSEVTDIEELDNANRFAVYPSAGKGLFNIKGSENTRLMIYNTVGGLVYDSHVDDRNVIDLTTRAKGIYFYRAARDGQLVATGKLLVQ